MDISRRKFLRFAPASVGVFAVGVTTVSAMRQEDEWTPEPGGIVVTSREAHAVALDETFVRQYEMQVHALFREQGSFLRDMES